MRNSARPSPFLPIKQLLFIVLVAAILLALSFPFRVYSEPPLKTPEAPEPKDLRYYADLHGADYNLALAIAICESRLEPKAKNPHSTAKGVFQFLDGTWRYYGVMKWGSLEGRDVLNYEDNVELGTWVIANFGTRDWLESAWCWLPKIQTP